MIKSNAGPVALSALTRKNNALAREQATAHAYNNNNNNNNSVVLHEHPAVSAARAYEEEEDLFNESGYTGASFAQFHEQAHSRPRVPLNPVAQVPGGLNLFKSAALQKLKARATRGHKAALSGVYNDEANNAGPRGVSAVSQGHGSDPRAVSGARGGVRRRRKTRRLRR
jgi:hypothetical protein